MSLQSKNKRFTIKKKAVDNEKPACRWCGKKTGKIRFYVIADDLERLKPYHKKCMKDLFMTVLIQLSLESHGEALRKARRRIPKR